MPKHVIYARKSSESEDRQILSVDSQIRQMKDLARRHGLEVAEVLTETRSAKAPGRPVFDALMRRIHKGDIATILAWKLDRLSRNHLDSGKLMYVLAEGFLEKIITVDGVKTQSGNDRFMGTMELAIATNWIDQLRVNTKRGTEERLRLGWAPYRPPPGYFNDRINKTIISDRKRLAMVQKMMALALSGMRPEQIRREANENWGFRTAQRKRSGGSPLSRSMIYKILSNPFYTGQIPYKGRLLPGKHEAIITREEFQQLQTILHRGGRHRPKVHEFAFTGLFKCGKCGAAITAEAHVKTSGRRFVYYRCTRRRVVAEACREQAIPEAQLLDQLGRTLGRLTIPEPVLAWMKSKVHRVLDADRARGAMVRTTLEGTLRSTEREIANLLNLRIRELVPDEVFTAKNQELEQRKANLTNRLATATEAGQEVAGRISELLDFAASVRKHFLGGSAVQQRAILEAVGSNYTLKGRTASFHLGKPLQLIAEAGSCSNWQRVVDDVRTWFLTTTDYFKIPRLDEVVTPEHDVAAQAG
jgi:DNA invertase Pin-like site-specific DNA recombinase